MGALKMYTIFIDFCLKLFNILYKLKVKLHLTTVFLSSSSYLAEASVVYHLPQFHLTDKNTVKKLHFLITFIYNLLYT